MNPFEFFIPQNITWNLLEESNSEGSNRIGYSRYYFTVALYTESVCQGVGYGIPCTVPNYDHCFYCNDCSK